MEVLSPMQLPWLLRGVMVCTVMLAASTCCYAARHIRPGYERALAVLPALIAMHCCPLLFDFRYEPLAAMSAAFLCTRLTAGKVAAFVLGRGALTLPLSLFQFTAVMLAPFMPAEIAADKVAAPNSSTPASEAAEQQQKAGLANEAPAAERAASGDILSPFKLAGLPQLQTMWQRASPLQRFSIDTIRSSIDTMRRGGSSGSISSSRSSSGNAPLLFGSSTSSPLDSPRIAAVRLQQDLAGSATDLGTDNPGSRPSTPASEQQQQQQEQGAQESGAASNAAAPIKALKSSLRPSRMAAAALTSSSTKSSNGRISISSIGLQGANLLLNVAVTLAFLAYSCHSWAAVRSVATQLGSLWVMWRAMELLMWGVSHPARTHLGMTLAPHFVNPFASTSLTNFWARRWNITQGLVLRFYVYEPIVQGCLVAPQAPQLAAVDTPSQSSCSDSTQQQQQQQQQQRQQQQQQRQQPAGSVVVAGKPPHGRSTLKHRKPSALSGTTAAASISTAADSSSTAAAAAREPVLARHSASVAPRWRRQLAAAATFVVSGLEHELFLWYLLRHWDLQWFCFFALQGLLLASEGKLKRGCKSAGLQLHPFVSHLAVLLALGVTADTLFWPPLLQPGMVQPLKDAVPPQLARWLGMAQ